MNQAKMVFVMDESLPASTDLWDAITPGPASLCLGAPTEISPVHAEIINLHKQLAEEKSKRLELSQIFNQHTAWCEPRTDMVARMDKLETHLATRIDRLEKAASDILDALFRIEHK